MIGIICPSIFEYRALDLPKLRRAGAVVVKSGMGKLRAMAACAKIHRENPKLRHMLLVGFAGGLTDSLQVGDVIEPQHFIEQDYFAEPFEKFPNRIKRKPSKKLISNSKEALLLTQDRFLTENPYKKEIYAKKYKNIACDMEAYAVAYYCQESHIPYSVLKFISDSADKNADHDFLKACKALSPKLNEVVLEAIRSLS